MSEAFWSFFETDDDLGTTTAFFFLVVEVGSTVGMDVVTDVSGRVISVVTVVVGGSIGGGRLTFADGISCVVTEVGCGRVTFAVVASTVFVVVGGGGGGRVTFAVVASTVVVADGGGRVTFPDVVSTVETVVEGGIVTFAVVVFGGTTDGPTDGRILLTAVVGDLIATSERLYFMRICSNKSSFCRIWVQVKFCVATFGKTSGGCSTFSDCSAHLSKILILDSALLKSQQFNK